MPCLNEAGFIEACLRSVQAQTYPPDRLEILVADGGSADGTKEILARLAAEDERIRVIDNPRRIQAAGLNCAIRASRGEVVVRMDVHAEYAPDYVEQCVEALERTGADNVGGAQRCAARNSFHEAMCVALRSPLGAGGAPYRDASYEGFVDTVFLGAFRRQVFDRIGLYDEASVANEDAEINQRIVQAGGRIYLSPEIKVSYFPRGSFAGVARQYYGYGHWRARTLLKHRRLLTVRSVLPFLTLLAGLVLLLIEPRWALAAILLYGALTLLEAIRVGHRLSPGGLATVWALFPVIQFSQGIGFGLGLVRYAIRRDWAPSPA
jgi:glycosyltransferase involved in cell wall biosynthesis